MERHTAKRRRKSVATDFDFHFKSSSQHIASSIQTRSQTRKLFYLPDELWESIFKYIISDPDIFKSLSVVSKQFLSVSDRLQFSLAIRESTRPFPPRLFQRFTNLISLDLSLFCGDINAILGEISCFPLKLTSLNLSFLPTIPADGLRAFSQKITTLTSLTCGHIKSINGADLFLIADCFPLLEKLDLHCPQEFENIEIFLNGIEAFCSALFKLRKVNLDGHRYINDQSLFDLFKNLKFLEEAIIVGCKQITNTGVASALRERPTLRSLSFSNYLESADNATFFALISNGPSLTEINLYYEWKDSVDDNSNPLMDVVVIPQLESLSLASSFYWLSDERMIFFVSLFPNLQRLNLSFCWNITEEGICQVLKRCRQIRHLNLTSSRLKLLGLNFQVPKLEVLNLSYTKIEDETLYVISKSCSGLLQLLLRSCSHITEKGVKHVVDNCTQLREINLTRYPKVHANVAASIICSRPSWREINISI